MLSIVDLLVAFLFVGRRAGWGYDYCILHGTLLCMTDCKSVPLISKGRSLAKSSSFSWDILELKLEAPFHLE